MRARLLLLLPASLVLASCSGLNDIKANVLQARMSLLETTIVITIGNAACRDSTDCRVIAFGSKPCGGPWEYLVYASSSVDTFRLEALVAEYNAINDELNRRQGGISDCMFVTAPRVTCVDGRCVAVAWDGATPLH